jgi:hypothetical protein
MVGTLREESPRILSSDKPKRVMERMQREETPRLGVSEGIRLRITRKESAQILSSDNPKGSWKGYKGKKPPGWGFPKG